MKRLLPGVLALAAGCSVGPDYQRPPAPVPAGSFRRAAASSVTSSGRGGASSSIDLAVNATWSLDLWGRIRRTVAAPASARRLTITVCRPMKFKQKWLVSLCHSN